MFSQRLSVVTLSVISLIFASTFSANAAPEPAFTLVRSGDGFEIRDYPELVIAKTLSDEGDNDAFRRLFAYISGANEGEREISMTAPVLVSEGVEIGMTTQVLGATVWNGSGGTEMAFILPEDYSSDTAPIPKDPLVSLAVIPARRVAVATFSGWADESDFAEAEADLRARLTAANIRTAEVSETAQYNPPWTLGPFRRNEVIIPVAAD